MAIKISTFSDGCTLLGGGTATIQIKIPGTYGGLIPGVSGFDGRRLIKIGLWFEGRAAGDQITTLRIKDIDSILSAPYTGAVVGNLIDQNVSSGNRALTLPPGGLPFTIEFPSDPTNPSYSKAIIPSGLYIEAILQKAIAGVDTAYVNMAWDDFT